MSLESYLEAKDELIAEGNQNVTLLDPIPEEMNLL